ncbi:MFS family permease [Paraburkholderia sp. GAS33]|uniref:MFS transporter n=1 Tax=Paraburkholderia sp. GAS33 TaxID=3035130 RepID=UPI003D1E9D84
MNWYASFSKAERTTFHSAFTGWVLDAFDFMVFTFVVTSLMTLWGVGKGEIGLLSTVSLLCSAAGGWVGGILADWFGRVKVLQWIIVWFSVFTFLIGWSQNVEQLFVLRALQGFGFGGEWAVGAVLIGEIVRPEHRGKTVGVVQSGWAIGWGLAAILYTVAFSVLPEALAWRSMFWVGLAPALLVFYIRRHVAEPESFNKAQQIMRSSARRPSFLQIFAPGILRTTVCSSLMCSGLQGGYYAIATWIPTFLRMDRHLSVIGTGGYLAVLITGSFIGYASGGYISDRIGRRGNMLLFAFLSAVITIAYTKVNFSNSQMLYLGFPLGFCASGIFGGVGAHLTELFPAALRANGQGFAYNFGRGIGALFPALVGLLSAKTGLGNAICILAVIANAAVFVTVLALPETRGRRLDDADHLIPAQQPESTSEKSLPHGT